MFNSIQEEAQFRQFVQLQQVDIQGQLKVMIGPKVQFQGIQEEVI